MSLKDTKYTVVSSRAINSTNSTMQKRCDDAALSASAAKLRA